MQQLVKLTHQTTNYSVLQKFGVWELLFITEERHVNTFVMLLQTLYYFANIKLINIEDIQASHTDMKGVH